MTIDPIENSAVSGKGRLVMLVGEPGIGKTRTAQELASDAETLGSQVLWGRCYEEDGAPPYWPWVQLIRSYVQQKDAEQLQAAWKLGLPSNISLQQVGCYGEYWTRVSRITT